MSDRLAKIRTAREQDLFKLYDSTVGQRDASGSQAVKVDARVEDEWDSIYVDCQDSTGVDYQDFSYDSGDISGSFSSIGGGAEGVAMGRDVEGARSSGSAAALPAQSRREGERWRANSSISSGGSRSALMAAMDAYQAAEEEGEEDEEGGEEERGGENKGFDEEEIIDCAIRGRWTFKNNDDPVRGG